MKMMNTILRIAIMVMKMIRVLLFLWRREPICQRYDLLIYQLPYSWILIHSFSSQSLSLPNLNLCSIDRYAESCRNRSSTSAIFILPLIYNMALSNQQTVDYLSFKLVIAGDGGTGKLFEVLFCFNNIDIRGEFMWLFGCKYFVMWKVWVYTILGILFCFYLMLYELTLEYSL
ncbi:hypothetical protein Hanom_Chr14g01267141 [Helianthus anomalus]